MTRGRKYKEKAAQVDKTKLLTPNKAFDLVKNLAFAKFDETVEVHFNLGIDPRHADQQLRGTMVLPHGIGKSVRVAVVAQGEKAKDAQNGGADVVGAEDLIEKMQEGWLEFDVLIATPDMMSKLGRLGKVLGTKGLMPNPKSGTVTTDVEKTVREFKAGKLEYRNDKTGIIHLGIGKVSFTKENLVDNFMMVYDTLLKVKPSKAKGNYLKSISISSSQGVGVFIEPLKVKWED